jgi:long-chain fatty acid transport protein
MKMKNIRYLLVRGLDKIVGRCVALLFGTAIFSPLGTQAVGFRLPNQDPEAIARGNAFTATADNPSAIYYNPAGITQLKGHNLRAGMYFVSGGIDYTAPTGEKAKTDDAFQPVPQFYYVYSPNDCPLSFGLGAYAPYGMSVDWGSNPPFRTLAQKGEVLYACFNPVVAWQVHRTLSLGIGPTINYSEANFKRGIGFMPGDYFKFDGDGMGYGFNAGVLWQPHEKWSFGVNYRYETEIEYRGKSKTEPSPPLPSPASSHGKVLYPQFAVIGVSFRPTPDWNLEFNVDWTDWDSVKQIVFEDTAFGDVPLPLNYRSSLMYEFGVTRQLGQGYFASLGYFFSENSSPDKNFSPIVPDSDLHLGSVGVGYRGKRWDWALAYHFGYQPKRVVSGSQPGGADGKYEILNHAFNFAATFKF